MKIPNAYFVIKTESINNQLYSLFASFSSELCNSCKTSIETFTEFKEAEAFRFHLENELKREQEQFEQLEKDNQNLSLFYEEYSNYLKSTSQLEQYLLTCAATDKDLNINLKDFAFGQKIDTMIKCMPKLILYYINKDKFKVYKPYNIIKYEIIDMGYLLDKI